MAKKSASKSQKKSVKKAVNKSATKPAKKSASANKTAPAKKVAPAKQKLAVVKTTQNTASVEAFIRKAPGADKQKDSFALLELMKKISGEEPKMWGSSIIGFGNKIYVSPNTGRAVDWMLIGFSPRKANLTIYLMNMAEHAASLKKLGKHKTGGGCLYINKLEDVDMKVLKEMITVAYKKNK
jgi:hypothetical protein